MYKVVLPNGIKAEVKDGYRLFFADDGWVYEYPEKHCAFCKHCKDFFFDYTNGPYMFLCDLEKAYEGCDAFEEEK